MTLICSSPDTWEKLDMLGAEAGDDLDLTPGDGGCAPRSRRAPGGLGGISRVALPGGGSTPLLKVLLTNACHHDCGYCVNNALVDKPRAAFREEELARAFMELFQRGKVTGLFLSSGIASSPGRTMERLIAVAEILRYRYQFQGYLHLKIMPGSDFQHVEQACRLANRVSVNLEAPTAPHLRRLSQRKQLEEGMLQPMRWVRELTGDQGLATPSQVTQLVIGAADESDRDIFNRVCQLYRDFGLGRVYYSAFHPIPGTPLEERPATPPLRQHRLYQVDWLHRVYGFPPQEMELAFDPWGHLSLSLDPKVSMALRRPGDWPLDLNRAELGQLLRVPGIGPISARRILEARRHSRIDSAQELQGMGVVVRRAAPFIHFPGHRPRGQPLPLPLPWAGGGGESHQTPGEV